MTKKEYETDDPFAMIGVEFSAQSEKEIYDMALCFAEEFVRQGWSEERLRRMFRNPFYQGPHGIWRQKGDEFVDSVIRAAVTMWRPQGGTHGSSL